MSGQQDWRIGTNGEDYLLHRDKQLAVADRRPVIRRGADLVGPGIGAGAVRLDDLNNLLGTFNGYYSSVPGALNAPDAHLPVGQRESFVGYVVSDPELGGRQVFTGLTSGTEYSRTFYRSPTDPEALGWSPWSGQRILPSAEGFDKVDTTVQVNLSVMLAAPALNVIGEPGIYERSEAGVRINKPGVYTGMIQVGDLAGSTVANLFVYLPRGGTTTMIGHLNVPLAQTFYIPFTVSATDSNQGFSVVGYHNSAQQRDMWWRFSCTRLGDAT